MFGQIGSLNAIGAPLSPNVMGGENFIRHVGNDKLIFDFHEGSGTTVRDKSREGNDGTLGTGAAKPTWRFNSVYFDGGDIITLVANFLAKADFVNGGSFIIIHKTPALTAIKKMIDIEGGWFVEFSADGKIRSNIDGSATAPSSSSSSRCDDNNWHCTIATWDKATSATVKNIINGVEDGTSTQDLYDIDGLNRLSAIGNKFNASGNKYIGSFNMVRILNKCLSGIECQQEYLANKWNN